ncbi:MAG: signal peptide peptidase SppA [Archaeoglobi archaeon]|nr:signal peptide peptidase SppA [Candidatus Mnemosynella sp.]
MEESGQQLRIYRILIVLLIITVIIQSAAIAYIFLSSQEISPPPIPQRPRIAVVYIQGTLTTGVAEGYASSDVIVRQLEELRDDGRVKAVILRINSPGGSPAAAQEIVEAVKKLREMKPVIASLGDIATSGAYYIAAPCNLIVASPDTMTGSIGAIWVFEDRSKYYEDEGIEFTVIKSGEMKDMGADWRALTEEEKNYAQRIVDEVFKRFLSTVSTFRNVSEENLMEISDGRVITGEMAKELGLVDDFGNLESCIELASEMLGLENPEIIYYNEPKMERNEALSYWEGSPYGIILV